MNELGLSIPSTPPRARLLAETQWPANYSYELQLSERYLCAGTAVWQLPELVELTDIGPDATFLSPGERLWVRRGVELKEWDLGLHRPGRRLQLPQPSYRFWSYEPDWVVVVEKQHLTLYCMRQRARRWSVPGLEVRGWLADRRALVISRGEQPAVLVQVDTGETVLELPTHLNGFSASPWGYAVSRTDAAPRWLVVDPQGRPQATAQMSKDEYLYGIHWLTPNRLLTWSHRACLWTPQGEQVGCLNPNLRQHTQRAFARDGELGVGATQEGLVLWDCPADACSRRSLRRPCPI